jgi:Domain of unknown function (DUF4395)
MTSLAPSLTLDQARPAGAIDVRGPRFAAAITSLVLATILLAPTGLAVALLVWQGAAFALGAARGVAHTPYSWVFRTFIRPRLSAPTEWEDPAPPRFAQAVGLAFVLGALVAYAWGATTFALILVGFALAAAVLNAVFAFCLGCEMYLLGKRFFSS